MPKLVSDLEFADGTVQATAALGAVADFSDDFSTDQLATLYAAHLGSVSGGKLVMTGSLAYAVYAEAEVGDCRIVSKINRGNDPNPAPIEGGTMVGHIHRWVSSTENYLLLAYNHPTGEVVLRGRQHGTVINEEVSIGGPDLAIDTDYWIVTWMVGDHAGLQIYFGGHPDFEGFAPSQILDVSFRLSDYFSGGKLLAGGSGKCGVYFSGEAAQGSAYNNTTGYVDEWELYPVGGPAGRAGADGTAPSVTAVIDSLDPDSWWKLDEYTGNFVDSGPGGITGTVVATTRRRQRGPSKESFAATKGSNQTGLATMGNNYPFEGRAPFTILIFFKPLVTALTSANYRRIFVKEPHWYLAVDSNGWSYRPARVANGGVPGDLTPGEWNMLALVYDGTNLISYLNGNSVSVVDTGNVAAGTNLIRVGSDNGSNVDFSIPGDFAHAAIWDTALTVAQLDDIWEAAEVSAKGETGSTGPTGPAGSPYTRTTVQHNSGSLAANASEDSTLAVHPGWRAFKVATNRPARVRVYDSAAHRTADAARPVGTDPTGNHGLLMEFVTTDALLEIVLSPAVDLASADGGSNFYVAVQNLDDATGVVTTTYSYVRTE